MTRPLKYAHAIQEALSIELRRDSGVVVFGEDVGAFGGVCLTKSNLMASIVKKRKLSKIGLQLYTVRRELEKDFEGTLAKVAPVDDISIPQQMARLASPGCRLDDLSPDPGGGRVGRHVDVHQLAPTVGDEHQHLNQGHDGTYMATTLGPCRSQLGFGLERLEGEGLHRQQVRGPHVVGVVGQERPPALA